MTCHPESLGLQQRSKGIRLAVAWVLWVSVGCALVGCVAGLRSKPRATVRPTAEPLVPTPLNATRQSQAVPGSPRPGAGMDPGALPIVSSKGRERVGVGVPGVAGSITDYPVERLGIGWYLNWGVQAQPVQPGGATFWQMVRVSERGYQPDAGRIRAIAEANPGATWIIGNEPDVAWQDNTTPEQYAEWYGELYQLLKSVDPACQVAIGGVSQPTPLRMAYLDRVLSAYERRYGRSMPVDIWSIHGFLLREQRDSWGVGIPPGFADESGVLYDIEDHDDLAAFQSQILAFRRWMAERGQRGRPLVVSEYGLLMPADYGFDEARVKAFLYATFDFFLDARDPEVGYPGDDNRLVQWWAWYSLADTVYPTGNLADPTTKAILPLGLAFAQYRPLP